MKNKLLALSLLTLSPLLSSDEAQKTQTLEERDLGAASVVQLFKVEQKDQSANEDEKAVLRTLNVAIIANGSASNPLSDIVISSETDEGDENPLPVHKIDTKGLNQVTNVEGKRVIADNSSAGFYILVKGSQNDLDDDGNLSTPKNKLITIKVTDSTGADLDNLEVTITNE